MVIFLEVREAESQQLSNFLKKRVRYCAGPRIERESILTAMVLGSPDCIAIIIIT